MVGYRTFTTVLTTLPAGILTPYVTILAIYRGDVKHPGILLSDIHAHPHWFYSASFSGSWFMLSLGMLVLFQTYSSVLRRGAEQVVAQGGTKDEGGTGGAGRGDSQDATLKELSKMRIAMGICEYCCSFGFVPGMFALLICDFSGEEEVIKDYWNAPFPLLFNWFMHCLGAFMVFGTAGFVGFLYTTFVEGTVRRHELAPPAAIRNLYYWARMTMWSSFLTGCIRGLHLYHDKHFWAVPLLIGEICIAEFGIGALLFGFLPIAKELDQCDPIFDLPFDVCRLFGCMSLDEEVDGRDSVCTRARGSGWGGLKSVGDNGGSSSYLNSGKGGMRNNSGLRKRAAGSESESSVSGGVLVGEGIKRNDARTLLQNNRNGENMIEGGADVKTGSKTGGLGSGVMKMAMKKKS